MITLFVIPLTSAPCQADTIAEKTINILVGFKQDAVIEPFLNEPLPAGVVSWHQIGKSRIVRMKILSSQANDVIKKLKLRSDVRYVEKSKRGKFQSDSAASDSALIKDLRESQWYQSIKGDSIAELSWGAGALVAVLDTGIDYRNQALAPGIFINSGEIPDDLQDNDKNGYIDDKSGWDIGDNDNNPLDENGHGTEVSSIIMAVAPHCIILPVKIDQAGDDSFETADLVEGIYYAISMGAQVINLSLTADQELQSVAEAVQAAHDAGIVVVAAAGNHAGSVEFPASMDETIAVGALYGDYPASFSAGGDDLDIMAPGVGVDCITLGGYKTSVSGTSFSCAMVSGACAVLRGMNCHLKADTVKSLLFAGVDDPGLLGRDIVFGEGVIDGKLLYQTAAPDLKLPFRPFYAFSRSVPVQVSFHLPPSDTSSFVFVGVFSSDNTLWWLDQSNQWHNAGQTPLSFLAGVSPLSESVDGVLFGENGAFPLFDPSNAAPGLYRWAIAVTDESGTLIGPVTYNYMFLY